MTASEVSLRPSVTANADVVDVDYLIVGAGPAGASLACFLGRYGTWLSLMSVQECTRLTALDRT
jgi:ribulose 1,5-bisphosphate synthetase/thiazole synthase